MAKAARRAVLFLFWLDSQSWRGKIPFIVKRKRPFSLFRKKGNACLSFLRFTRKISCYFVTDVLKWLYEWWKVVESGMEW